MGYQHSGGVQTVLCLNAKICGGKLRISRLISDNQPFARSGMSADFHLTVKQLKGCQHPFAPRPYDFVYFKDTLGSISHGCNSLTAAYHVYFISTAYITGDQSAWRHRAIRGCRGADYYPRHSRNFSRQNGHHHRRWEPAPAAGDITPDLFQGDDHLTGYQTG